MAQPQQPAALQRPVVVPDVFSGAGGDWMQWLQQFNAACVVNGYGDADRLRFLPARLSGTAHQSFQTIAAANPNSTYPQICTLLTQQFEPPEQQHLFEAQLRIRMKTPDESQLAFANAFA